MPSMARNRTLRVKYRMHSVGSCQTKKPTLTGESVFAKGIEKLEKTSFQVELISESVFGATIEQVES